MTAVSPITALATGGVTVTITGINFTGVNAVMFGTTAATSYTYVSATLITAVAPPEAIGTVDITVTTTAGTSPTELCRPVQLLHEPLVVPGLTGEPSDSTPGRG